MSLTHLKEKIYGHCHSYILQRIETALQAIASVEAAGEEETKSSAGDKYETSREMMKQELERHQQLLAGAREMERTLEGLRPTVQNSSATIVPGSLIRTDQGLLYLAVGIGKLSVEGQDIFVLSPSAPVGKLLFGKQAGDRISFNTKSYHILEIG